MSPCACPRRGCYAKAVTSSLLTWFYKVKRDLPWRKERTGYRVWISEIMLQQTQVATVIPYFERWLERFPDLETLATAPLDDVLKLWEGLGYYRRARNLHRAAQVVFERGGIFPKTYEGWLELPGVGPYTAAAVSSIVNGERVVAVDGNVKRVAARLFMLDVPNEKEVRQLLTPYLPKENPGDFNEALMELGATVCTKAAPACLFCPVQEHCQAFAAGEVSEFPKPKKRLERPHYTRYALVDFKNGTLWLRQRSENEMLNGLWGFVLSDEKPAGKSLPAVNHAYTHFSQTVTPVFTNVPEDTEGRFVSLLELDTLALSTLDHKIISVLREAKLL